MKAKHLRKRRSIPRAAFSVIAVAVAAAVVACNSSSAGSGPEAGPGDPGSVFLNGPIDKASLEAIERQLTPSIRRLVINSPGGRIPEALRLGEIVRSRNLQVVVERACLSACAHFVFAPARHKTVQPNSLVGFHNTATSIAKVLRASGRADLAATYEPIAKLEGAFYTRAGLQLELLDAPLSQVDPLCYVENTKVPAHSEYRSGVFTTYTFFVPAKATLEDFGLGRIAGAWPASLDDLRNAAGRFPPSFKATFKLEPPEGAAAAPALKAVPECRQNDGPNK